MRNVRWTRQESMRSWRMEIDPGSAPNEMQNRTTKTDEAYESALLSALCNNEILYDCLWTKMANR
jgi:hypothetical protein